MRPRCTPVFSLWFLVGITPWWWTPAPSVAQDVVPHGQSRAPGLPLSPGDAVKKMTVPEGFKVEVFASEPDLVNPVAMTFDERGRVWVTESLEYPRKSAGPGRDRVKVMEDTDGDGKADKFSVFAEGLNIPSGIAVGHGGVWVANSPDILFLQDTDGDGKADRREIVVTGFGRDDTHELPNSLSWGPDGWLYGWNGVFNQSRIRYRNKTYNFTCAIFRIHPKTREFEVFCEGTSNPWGITWDDQGAAFASACVIDHLWHLTESGYYHRQGGPYPPFTWKIESIVGHNHQKAAYCGIHYYDSDAYPPAYRKQLFMGNIHGNCVNVDTLSRNGSTYKGTPGPDFLSANDAWFMPVAQKTGPDGSIYVLDWYDRYHCYQDANRDPAGIDRLKGRLYRVRYKDTPRRFGFDLSAQTDDGLVGLLGSPNGYDRETARRLLAERDSRTADSKLRAVALDTNVSHVKRMNALWASVSRATPGPDFLLDLMRDDDPGFRAWGVRAAGNAHRVAAAVRDRVVALANDRSPDVQLQVAVAARKVEGVDALAVLTEVASSCGNDPLIPHVVWQNLHPLLDSEAHARRFIELLTTDRLRKSPALLAMVPRVVDRLFGASPPSEAPFAQLLLRLSEIGTPDATQSAREAVQKVTERVQTGELAPAVVATLRASALPTLEPLLRGSQDSPLSFDVAMLATSLKHPSGSVAARESFLSGSLDEGRRIAALKALISAGDGNVVEGIGRVLADPRSTSPAFRGQVLASLGRLDTPAVADLVIGSYPKMEPELRPQAVELLTQRGSWRLLLVMAVRQNRIPASDLNVNQIRKLLADKDPLLVARVKQVWGSVREGRNPDREKVIDRIRSYLKTAEGDPHAGSKVFQRVCGQCHKIYGEGQEVGPEITLNGRNSFEQLLSNVFDPSLVIGASYQGTTVATTDGRVITGLLVEDGPQRVVLKTQGAKLETVPRAEVDGLKVSPLSLMPEDLEKQIPPQEIADLFAFLTLDRPPSDPNARPIPGAQAVRRKAGAR